MLKPITVLIVFFAILIVGCAGTKQVVKTNTPVEKEIVIKEDFDPATLNDYDFPIENKKQATEKPLDIDEFLSGKAQLDSAATNQLVPGFRVQLLATRSRAEAQSIKREALLDFEQYVYLVFNDPYYKIRLGDFQNRFQANDLQEVAITKGYAEAWVVRTMINDNPAALFKREEDQSLVP